MKKVLKVCMLTLVLFGALQTVQAQKFGYVNSAELLSSLPGVKQAESSLEALQKQLQKQGQGMVEKLQQDYTLVQQKAERGELSPRQQEEEAKKLEERQAEIAKFEQDMVSKLQAKRNELLKPIYDSVNEAIAAVAKENGYTFIFDQQVLLYFEEGDNVGPMVKAKLGIQ